MKPIQDARQIHRALMAQSIAFGPSGDFAAGANSAVLCLRFADKWSRGGVLMHFLSAEAFEQEATQRLNIYNERLDAETCVRLAHQLSDVDRHREDFDDVLRRDRVWEELSIGFWSRARWAIDDMLPANPMQSQYLELEMRRNVRTRLTMIVLAIQAYTLDKQAPPTSLDQLLPKYLPRLPLDPYSNKPILYRIDGNAAIVYSVGPDGDDDGGRGINWGRIAFGADGDVGLEFVDRDNAKEDEKKSEPQS